MKKWVVFLLGFIVGIVFTFVAIILCVPTMSEKNNGMTFFEEPGECMSTLPFKVIQVVEDNGALACEVEYDSFLDDYISNDLVVFLMSDNGEYYYDGQLVEVPKGKCMCQVGVYKYMSQMGIEKTVPIVKIMDM